MPKKRQISADQFAKKFARIAADYLETVPVKQRDARIAALKTRISKSRRGIRPTNGRSAETPSIPLVARSRE